MLYEVITNSGQCLVVLIDYDRLDIVLKGDQECVLVAKCLIDSDNQHLLDLAFRHRASIAEQTSVFQAANTPPDDGLFATVVPVNPSEHLSAVAADNHLGEAVIAAEGSVLPVWAGVDNSAADQLLLHLHENFTRDDGFMAVLYIVLRNDTVVLDPLLCNRITSYNVCYTKLLRMSGCLSAAAMVNALFGEDMGPL